MAANVSMTTNLGNHAVKSSSETVVIEIGLERGELSSVVRQEHEHVVVIS